MSLALPAPRLATTRVRGLRGWAMRRLLRLAVEEATAALHTFRYATPALRERIEQLAETYFEGYLAAIEENAASLRARLERAPSELRSFAYEGAGTGLAALDAITPWQADRLGRFLRGPGADHAYIVHIGAGWAIARLPHLGGRIVARLDPVLRWLGYDGWGFHEGLFASRRTVEGRAVPGRLAGYARRAFDHGVGRSLWFVEATEPERIARRIATFEPARQDDLWSGVGLACAYAGRREEAALRELARLAGAHAPYLAQGAAFAAESRRRSGEEAPQTDLACRVFCRATPAEAAAAVAAAGRDLPPDGALPAFEVWRLRVRERFSQAAEA